MCLSKVRTIITVVIAVLSLFVTAAFPQQGARDLFERARMLDESNQNLSEAIKLYGQVVSQSNEQRALAARAQFRIGILYERLGRKAEAQRAFQVVVSQYADQEVAQRARAKVPAPSAKANLITKSAGARYTTPLARQLWAGADVDTEGAPSPDGRYLSFNAQGGQGDLAVRDLLTGETRTLTRDGTGGCPECGEESIWSPDGKQIVYGWLSQENQNRFPGFETVELRLIGADGSGKRVLYRPDGPIYTWPSDWYPMANTFWRAFIRVAAPNKSP
jgi:Tol biopolymer transport system component